MSGQAISRNQPKQTNLQAGDDTVDVQIACLHILGHVQEVRGARLIILRVHTRYWVLLPAHGYVPEETRGVNMIHVLCDKDSF